MKVWYALLLYVFIQSITPGPNNLTCLYLGAKYGFKGTRKFMTGSMLSFLFKTLLCGLLNLLLAKYIPVLVDYLKWIGAAYMVYLGWCMAKSGWQEESKLMGQQTESTYRSGIILQLLNIKSWIASLSMFAVYVIPVNPKMSAILWASLAFFIIALVCSIIWALFGSVLRKFIAKYKKPFGIIMGLSLLYCAITAVL